MNLDNTQSIPAASDIAEIDPALEADYQEALDYDRACDLGGEL